MENYESIKANILAVIKDRAAGVTFVELEHHVDGFSGDMELFIMDNIVLWQGISTEAMEAISELMKAKLIKPDPANPLVYVIDGKVIDLPLVKNNVNYKKPRWLPVVFSYIGVSK